MAVFDDMGTLLKGVNITKRSVNNVPQVPPPVNIFFYRSIGIISTSHGNTGEINDMGRKSAVSEADLRVGLSHVFRDVGYEGATMAMLSEATGLQKASLYHRFPHGKEQMAGEVLRDAGAWLEEHILAPLRAEGDPRAKLVAVARRLDEFYSGGRQACLLNMLSATRMTDGPFTKLIKGVFKAWVTTVSKVLVDAGLAPRIAEQRAERAMILLQGTLVYARGVGSTRPFKNFLKTLPAELLAGARPDA
jgi:TetR/AcrR family transcriptional regulator, lmrAB and yxaGH operons repressor